MSKDIDGMVLTFPVTSIIRQDDKWISIDTKMTAEELLMAILNASASDTPIAVKKNKE